MRVADHKSSAVHALLRVLYLQSQPNSFLGCRHGESSASRELRFGRFTVLACLRVSSLFTRRARAACISGQVKCSWLNILMHPSFALAVCRTHRGVATAYRQAREAPKLEEAAYTKRRIGRVDPHFCAEVKPAATRRRCFLRTGRGGRLPVRQPPCGFPAC